MVLTVSVVTLAIALYVSVSFAAFMAVSLKTKLLLSLFFLLLSQKFTFYYFLSGDFFNPVYNRTVLIVCEALFNILLVMLPLLVLKDLGFWISRLVNLTGLSVSWPLSRDSVKWALLAISMVGAFYGTYAALKVPDVKRVEIQIKNLPSEFENYRLVLMADLHIGRLMNQEWLEATIERANALKPDAIVLSGDLIEGKVGELASMVAPYRQLQAKDGVYAVSGNHEWYHGALSWERYFESLGIQMMENRHAVIARGDANLVIAGTIDRAAGRFFGQTQYQPDLKKALAGVPEGPVILLAHQPVGAREVQGVDLQLSGHTHGGLYMLYQPVVALGNDGFVTGHYQANDRTQLYVTPGTGLWTGMSLRLGVPSEITEIILKKR